jgi:hypothetical protein
MRHRHERSMWLICSGQIMWRYQCGAWRGNWVGTKWQKPSGLGGPNPAMKETP